MLQARTSLPGDCEYSQQRQRQKPGGLPCQRFVEEPQWAGCPGVKGSARPTTALRWLLPRALRWLLLCRALRGLLSRASLRLWHCSPISIRVAGACVRPASKSKMCNETANAIVAKGKADLRDV